ncbi:hypothetical protein CJ030_MR4G022227 [Morella rubra]|uniref:Uncharacterized protein n=1 Tax=Morella rubra TaxID=262757 RepID=A0A6A1VU26_9ROSI|nr:hypothetical protein CJ030_MR4G022227 [Morella rubra]
MANEIKKSSQSTWALAHASKPVNAMAKRLSGFGSSRSPRQCYAQFPVLVILHCPCDLCSTTHCLSPQIILGSSCVFSLGYGIGFWGGKKGS